LPAPPGEEEAAAEAAVGRGESEVEPAGSERAEDTGDTPATAKAPSVPAPAGGRGDATGAVDLPPPELAGAHQPRRRPLPWAQTLKRVFFVDALSCPPSLTAMVVLALLSDPPAVKKILPHLGLPAEAPPLAPAMLAASDGGFGINQPSVARDRPAKSAFEVLACRWTGANGFVSGRVDSAPGGGLASLRIAFPFLQRRLQSPRPVQIPSWGGRRC
jgi:hypothetical protein